MGGRATRATSSTQYYTYIDGMRFDRALLEQAEGFAKQGAIQIEHAGQLWASAHDGRGVTATERRTLEYALNALPFQNDAKQGGRFSTVVVIRHSKYFVKDSGLAGTWQQET